VKEVSTELEHARDAIGQWFTELFADLSTMSSESQREIRGVLGTRTDLTEKHLRAIQPAATAFLDRHPVPLAAGLVLGPGIIDDTTGAIEWWRRGPRGRTQRIVFTLNPDAAGFYDYLTYDWFTEVINTGAPAIQGPYLDYAGLDQYILTSMVPFYLDGALVGTAGCDTEVRALEPVVMPHLRQIPMDVALVSKFDRIVVGNSGRFLVGNRVGDLPRDALRVPLPGVDLGLQLVAAPRTHTY
jgi:hypothetical protein